jgi:hypothetical protein
MNDINPASPNDKPVQSDNVVTLAADSRPTLRTRRASKEAKGPPKRPTTALKFAQDENDPDPASVLIALRYQFEAIDHILGSNPGDAHFDCMASYLALAGVAAVRLLEKRMEETGS